MKQRFAIYLLIWFGLSINAVNAQDFIRLKGTLIEEGTNLPIPYVTVRIKGAPLGTLTNLQGKFSFWIDPKYRNATVVFSSIGFVSKEISVSDLAKNLDAQIVLTVDVRELGLVTVTAEKGITALEVLKRAIAKIPDNYVTTQHSYDAYYREKVLENGTAIKFADAVISVEQTPYSSEGKARNLGNGGSEWKSAKRYGTWLAAYPGIGKNGERLHDHFAHGTEKNERVKIQQARISLNHTRENLLGSIEGGPLATVGKDIVKYKGYFMNKKKFNDYAYELAELPVGDGNWDYVVSFKPKRKPQKIAPGMEIIGGGIRRDIFEGEIYIDQKTYAIKKVSYRVARAYKMNICSLGPMQIIHYGYNVDVDYAKYSGKWHVQKVRREDEFMFPDTLNQKVTPYSSISEVTLRSFHKTLTPVAEDEHFENANFNSLENYHGAYDAGFWTDFEAVEPLARIDSTTFNELSSGLSLTSQFELQNAGRTPMTAPIAEKTPMKTVIRDTTFMDDYGRVEHNSKPYLMLENNYSQNYLLPLHKTHRFLKDELTLGSKRDSIETWSDFKKSAEGELYHVRSWRIKTQAGAAVPVTMLMMGKDKDRWLKLRPVLFTVIGDSEGFGDRIKFDPKQIPITKRGIVLVYIHLKGVEKSSEEWFLGGGKRNFEAGQKIVDVIKHFQEEALCHPKGAFLSGSGIGASIIANAINIKPDLCSGAFLADGDMDLINGFVQSSRFNEMNGRRKAQLMEEMLEFSPYHNVREAVYPNTIFFTSNAKAWQSAKVIAKLRSLNQGNSTLLLTTELPTTVLNKNPDLLKLTYQYALMFQWLDDLEVWPNFD